MEILKNFGFDPVMLAAQIINFLIIFYLLKRFLYKPVFDMLKKEKIQLKRDLKQAEEARLTLEKTLEEEKKILTKARDEAKKIEENTKTAGRKTLLEAKQKIEQEAAESERRITEK